MSSYTRSPCPRSLHPPDGRGDRIFPGHRPPADAEDVGEHAGGVAEEADFALGVVEPADGDFGGGEAALLREEEDLDVEAEALDLHCTEHRQALLAGEELEAALG